MEREREVEKINLKGILDEYSKKIDKKLLLKLHDADETGIDNLLEQKVKVQVNGKTDNMEKTILNFFGRYTGELTYRQILEMIPDEKYTYFKLVQ